jgi:hypothetical protein
MFPHNYAALWNGLPPALVQETHTPDMRFNRVNALRNELHWHRKLTPHSLIHNRVNALWNELLPALVEETHIPDPCQLQGYVCPHTQ